MLPISSQSPLFEQAEQKFDLDRLRSDLESVGQIDPKAWDYLKGILCGLDQEEIAKRCSVAKGTVKTALTRGARSQILGLFSDKSEVDWKRLPAWLIEVGYGIGENYCVNWKQVCRAMLDRQIQFPTLNDLMAKDGVRIDPTLFVPVGLVERKQKQYRRSDLGSSEQGSQLLQPTEEEIVKRFDNEEDFFSQVICNSDLSSHSRLVITGEPGAGKTTLLQKIGDRLCQAGMFPIWFSLGKSGVLPTYEFLSRVLKENAQPRNFESSSWDASINALLQTDKVWLLLDGADEFTTNGNPLHIIGSQLREAWASQVRIVLTCRLNVWDTYALPEFKVFRTLEFDYRTPVDGYPNQVEAYIYRFFAKDGVDPQLSHTLIQQLQLSGKGRIRDSVKNPLRLSLLCYVWESRIGELPDTRAELYRIFVDYYYDLQERKHSEIRIDCTERDTLNLALGEVAKATLDSHDSRFRLRKSLIETIPTMGKESAKDSLFDKAIRLGWLNRIGTTAEKPYEAEYAFFHTTFQGYFAALAINDYFFMNHIPGNSNHPDASYRIFEPQWKEVFLLWLGRENIEPKDKEGLIKALIEFDDECGNFYQYRTYCLAASGISELVECSFKASILEQVATWHLGYFRFSVDSKRWIQFLNPNPIDELVELTLLETNRDALIDAIVSLITKNLNNSICRDAARFLGRFRSNNRKAIQALIDLLQNNPDREVRQQAVESLGEISSEAPEVIDVLDDHLLNSQDKEGSLQIAKSLGKLSPGSSNAIKVLVEALLSSEDSFDSRQISWLLREVDINKVAVLNIVELLSTSQSEGERQFLNEKLAYIDPENSEITNNLRRILRANCDDAIKFKAATSLLEIDSKDFDAISSLISLLQNTQDIEVKKQIIGCLGMFVTDSLDAVDALSSLLYPEQDETILILASEMLRHIGSENRNAILALTQLIQVKQESELQYHYAECLGEIDLGNSEAIIPFVKLLEAENDDESKIYAIDRLSNIGALESSIIKNKLFNLLDSSQSQRVCLESAWNLWLYSACNRNLIYTLLSDQLFSNKDEETCRLFAWRLKGILKDELFHNTVARLAENLSMTACKKYLNVHRVYFNLAAFCMQKMPYLDFYRAWHYGLNQ